MNTNPTNTSVAQVNIDGSAVMVDTSCDTLLEMLEKASVDVQSHCRDGFCGCCRIKLEQGDIEWVIDPLASINDDEVLACACKPVGTVSLRTQYSV
jgi:ferredoxin